MYTSIHEVPTQVLSSLSDEDAGKWMDSYNKAIKKKDSPSTNDILDARRHAWYAVKDAPSSFSFCIKASVEDVDKQHELITMDSIKKSLDGFIANGGNVNYNHDNYNVGCIWGWDPITVKGLPGVQVWGNIYGGGLVYDTIRKAFVDGTNSLSIGGEASNPTYTCDDKGCYYRKDVLHLMEISLTKRPINHHATLVWYNNSARMTKSQDEGVSLQVEEYTVHKSETECPILGMRKSLRGCGLDAHAREHGCFIPTEYPLTMVKSARDAGVWCEPHIDDRTFERGVFVPTPSYLRECEFKKAYKMGIVDDHGYLRDYTTKSLFEDLWDKGVIEFDEKGARFKVD